MYMYIYVYMYSGLVRYRFSCFAEYARCDAKFLVYVF